MAELQANPKMTMGDLANKNITPTIAQGIEASDAKTQLVFKKVLEETMAFIQTNGQLILSILAAIEVDTNGDTASGKFMSSFVLPQVPSVIGQLGGLDSTAFDHTDYWGVEKA